MNIGGPLIITKINRGYNMETASQYKTSVQTHSRNINGYNRFIGIITTRFNKAELYEKFKFQLNYIFDLHKAMYEYVPYAQKDIQSFEESECAKFIECFDNLVANSRQYTYESFCGELGKQLNRLTKAYNNQIESLKKIKSDLMREAKQSRASLPTNPVRNAQSVVGVQTVIPSKAPGTTSKSVESSVKLPGMFNREPKEQKVTQTGLKFVVNPPEQRFNKDTYMEKIEQNREEIPKAFEKSIPWAVSQFPDRLLREKIQQCIKYHRALAPFVDDEYDTIIRFENLATSYYLDLVCSLVTIPQPLADTQEKFLETAKNLNKATDDYQEAIKKLIDKFMKKVNMSNETQLKTFENIVNNLL